MKKKILINSRINDYTLANQGSRAKRGVLISLTIILISLIWLSGFSEIQAENQSEIDKAVEYLMSQPQYPWITMALVTAGKTDSDLNYLKTVNGDLATDYENTILALTAAGKDPRTFGNIDFVAQLKGLYQNNQIGSADLLNDDFWGILALVSAGEDPSSQIIQDSQNFILTNQNSDGGFPFSGGWGSDIDDTAAAIMALLEVGIKTDDPVIVKAIDYLKTNQNNDGGFPYDPVSPWGTGSDASSDAWVISAVNKLGEDPNGSSWSKNGVSPVDHLLSLQAGGGYFEWQEGTGEDSFSPVTTSYAVIALSQKFYPINKLPVPVISSGSGGIVVPLYTISASADEHGLIAFSGLVSVDFGSDWSFTITSDTGYHVSDVLVDGSSVGAVNSYTFNSIAADHTILASFAVNEAEAITENNNVNDNNITNEYVLDATINQGQPDLSSVELNQGNLLSEGEIVEPNQTHQTVEQQEQVVIPQQEEPVSIPAAAQANLLTGIINILSFRTSNIWLAIIVIIFVSFILTAPYLYRKGKMKKNNIYIIIGVGIIVVIGSWLLLSNGFWQANVKETNIVQEITGKEVVLVIDDGEGNPNTFVAEFKEGMTAFDLLKEESEKLSLKLETKNYDIGIFIEAIGDKENGQDGKYWLYYVNGKMPMVASDKKELKSGDKVEFKFEKSTF